LPALQALPGAQSRLDVQEVWQAPPGAHAKGPQPGSELPGGSGVHAPVPQPSHAPSQRVSQQVPSTQRPDRHAVSDAQVAPFARCGTHAPWSRYCPVGQSTQTPETQRRPAGQLTAKQSAWTHESFAHTSSGAQGVPLQSVGMHVPLAHVLPGAHVTPTHAAGVQRDSTQSSFGRQAVAPQSAV
jgi:hypothetical protein